MSAFENCEVAMNYSQLRKFAANQRRLLLSCGSEKSAYCGFMRLCGTAIADRNALKELISLPVELRCAFFCEKCRQLAAKYGGIFSLYGELPMPPQLFAAGGTAAELLELPAELFSDIGILGWLHQYYNEPYRSEIAVGLKKSKRLEPHKTAAATQIFTPEPIVRYMVENTLVRCLRSHGFKVGMDELFFGDETKNEQKVAPESITFMDPCAGSGNVLLYAFDVFMEMYRNCGVSDAEAAERILRHNLFGMELDERACAAAETVLRLKAAEYGSFAEPQVYDVSEVAEVVGSLINCDEIEAASEKALKIGQLLKKKYTIIATNPPYLARASMNTELSEYIAKNYGEFSADMFSVFIVRCMELSAKNGYLGFLVPSTWLFLRSYEKLRRRIYADCTIQTLIHFEYSAFADATVPLCAFTMKNSENCGKGTYLRLSDFKGGMEVQMQKCAEALADKSCQYRFEADTKDFLRIPYAPAAYWFGRGLLRAFEGKLLGDIIPVKEGLITGDNDHFLRRWYEVASHKTAFSVSQNKKWYLIDKGGEFRKWCGNMEFVVNWENDGAEIKSFCDEKGRLRSRPQGLMYNFKSSVSWSQITSGELSVRYFDENYMFNVAGTSAFPTSEKQLLLLLGLLNSNTAAELARVLNPTMNMNPGDLARLPLPDLPEDCTEAEELVRENICLCRDDWNSFETAFGFRRHPLL